MIPSNVSLSINASSFEWNGDMLPQYGISYSSALHTIASQLSDRIFFASIILLLYVLANSYVFYEDARWRGRFERLFTTEVLIFGNPVGAWVFEIVRTSALVSAVGLVVFNIIVRTGWNI